MARLRRINRYRCPRRLSATVIHAQSYQRRLLAPRKSSTAPGATKTSCRSYSAPVRGKAADTRHTQILTMPARVIQHHDLRLEYQ